MRHTTIFEEEKNLPFPQREATMYHRGNSAKSSFEISGPRSFKCLNVERYCYVLLRSTLYILRIQSINKLIQTKRQGYGMNYFFIPSHCFSGIVVLYKTSNLLKKNNIFSGYRKKYFVWCLFIIPLFQLLLVSS